MGAKTVIKNLKSRHGHYYCQCYENNSSFFIKTSSSFRKLYRLKLLRFLTIAELVDFTITLFDGRQCLCYNVDWVFRFHSLHLRLILRNLTGVSISAHVIAISGAQAQNELM